MFALVGSTSAGSLFAKTASAGYGGGGSGNKRVEICHDGKTIKVAKPAVSAHLNHGDTEVPCAPTPVVLGASTTDVGALKGQLISLINQLISNLRAQLISAK